MECFLTPTAAWDPGQSYWKGKSKFNCSNPRDLFQGLYCSSMERISDRLLSPFSIDNQETEVTSGAIFDKVCRTESKKVFCAGVSDHKMVVLDIVMPAQQSIC